MDYKVFIGITLLCTGGVMSAVYEVIANPKGWLVGFAYRRNGFMTIIGGFVVLISLILSIIFNPWWTFILNLIISFIIAQILIRLIGHYSQILIPILLLISAVYIIELLT